MKLSLTATLIEQHKTHKDEMGIPPYDTVSTPDNHISDKRHKKVKPKHRTSGAYQESGDNSVGLRNPNAGGTVVTDGGIKNPKVAKMAKSARHGKTGGVIGGEKTNAANVGDTRKLPKTYMGGERVEVAKVHESLKDIANFLGTDLTLSTAMIEAYPDDYDSAAFDRAYGTDADDKKHDDALENMEYEVQEFLKTEGPGFIADYKKYKNHPKGKADSQWYMENLAQLVEGALDAAFVAIQTDGYEFEVDNDRVKALLETYMANAGVAPEDIIDAFTDIMDESVIDEDRLGGRNDLSNAESILRKLGYSVIGGGFVGGQKNYKNDEGNIVSVSVNTFKPTEVIGWKSKDGKSGKTVADMSAALQGATKTRGMFAKFGNYKNRGVSNENSSGGAVGGGAIASTAGGGRPQSQLFAGEADEAHGTGDVYLDYSHRIDAMGKHGNFDSMWTTISDAVTHDDRLTHDEISDLQSALHRAKKQRIFTPSDDDFVNIPQDIDTYVAQLDKFLEPNYYLSWEEAAGDRDLIAKAIEKGMTPEEFGAAWAKSTGMDTVDGNWG